MSEDILLRLRAASGNNEMQFTPDIYNEALISFEDQCLAIVNKSLRQLEMVAPNRSANDIFDRDFRLLQGYDTNKLNTLYNRISQNCSLNKNMHTTQ